MKIVNNQQVTFGMKIKGLDKNYFQSIPKHLSSNLVEKAEKNTNADFTIEFVPTSDNWVFLKKIDAKGERIVDYFPNQYSPADIVRTFTKAYIPDYRVMAKKLRNEYYASEAQRLYGIHSKKF